MTDLMSSIAARDAAHLIHPVTAPRELAEHGPRVVVSGDGWMVTDDRGRDLIDGFAGLWCVTVGHGRREIVEAARAQMEELAYFTTFHGQGHPRAAELAERLVGMFPPAWGLNRVMFSSGGSEANETNFKIARLYHSMLGQERKKTIIARHHGYHGLTIATMTATGIMPMRWHFGPDAPGFDHIAAPYCYRCELDKTYPDCGVACASELERMIEREGADTIGAFIAEPVIGAGGIIPPPPEYFPMVREICDRYGILLILDEVVTGFGRTGTMFGAQQWDVRPDIVTLAKGISSGYVPLGASMVSEHVWSTISEKLPDHMPFSHGFTYSGHPVACAAALANLDIIENEDLPGNAARVGAHLMERMRELERFDSVGEVRGMGLMIGMELVTDKGTKRGFSMPHSACTRVETEAWERGLYARAMGTEVIGIAPPLIIDNECADRIVELLADSIEAMEKDILTVDRARAERRSGAVVSSPSAFFTAVLPERFDAEQAAGVEVELQFSLHGDGGGTWMVHVADGKLEVEELDAPTSDAMATIKVSAADFVRMVNGELSGADAFAGNRLVIDGDLNAAARLMTLGIL